MNTQVGYDAHKHTDDEPSHKQAGYEFIYYESEDLMEKVWRTVALSLLLSLGVLVFIWKREGGIDFSKLASVVHPNPVGFLLIVATLLLWWVIAGLRISILAQNLRTQVTLAQSMRAYLLGLFMACVTPGAAGLNIAMGWYLSRFVSNHQAAAIALFTIVLDLIFYSWSLPVSYFVLQAGHAQLPAPGWVVALVSFAFLFFAWGLAFQLQGVARFVGFVFNLPFLKRFRRQAIAEVLRTGRGLAEFRSVPLSQQLLLHGLTALFFVLHYFVLNAVALALGLTVQHTNLLALQTFLVAFGAIVPTPGGAGYFEAGLGVLLSGQVPAAAKTLLILLWRFFSYWIYFFIGPVIGGTALLRSRSNHDLNIAPDDQI